MSWLEVYIAIGIATFILTVKAWNIGRLGKGSPIEIGITVLGMAVLWPVTWGIVIAVLMDK